MKVKAANKPELCTHVARSIKRLYKQSAPLLLAEALLFFVIAGAMFFYPVSILTTMTMIIGVVLIGFGLYRTIAGYIVSHNRGGGYFDLCFGLINIILGFLFCVHPTESMISVMYIFLVLFFVKSLLILIFAINMARARFGHYIISIFVALVMMGVAIIFMLYPLRGAVAITFFMGGMLVLYAVADVYMFVQLYRLRHRVAE
ncbi:MAG: DUF308 domain-containing protein [Alphaproteobacteria bacterium]|nr:DUF308 domain-containing protein [Alphaproteobacteria bacterium]